jgi:hypothetical protein
MMRVMKNLEHWDMQSAIHILLHLAIAHMHNVDGALQGKQDGTKSLDLLAPADEHK